MAKFMSLESAYPKTAQWVRNGGTLSIQTVGEMGQPLQVEVAIGDAGGIPEGCRITALTLDQAMVIVEAKLSDWIEENRKLLDAILAGEVKDKEHEYLMVAGYPPVKNPYFAGNDI